MSDARCRLTEMTEARTDRTSDDTGPDVGEPPAIAALIPGGFAPVTRNPRLADKVTEQLLVSIKSDDLPPGSRLPSEREMGEMFGVSRTVVREAVRSLTAKGVLSVRPGSGVLVAAADAASVSEQMSLFLRGRGALEYRKINEVRAALEVSASRLAALRATPADVAELREHCERMALLDNDIEAASSEDVEFHRSIARATDNELFVVMLDSIGDILLEIRRVTLAVPGRVEVGVFYHRQILERIEAHDVDGAAVAMSEHLANSSAAWTRAGSAAEDD